MKYPVYKSKAVILEGLRCPKCGMKCLYFRLDLLTWECDICKASGKPKKYKTQMLEPDGCCEACGRFKF